MTCASLTYSRAALVLVALSGCAGDKGDTEGGASETDATSMAYFSDCLAGPDVRTIALCLHEATDGEALQVCEPGGSFEEEI